MYATFSFSIHSSMDTPIVPLRATVNNAAVQESLQDPDFTSFGRIPRSGIAGPHGNSVLNSLRNFHSVFRTGYTNLYFHQQCLRVSFLHTLTNT